MEREEVLGSLSCEMSVCPWMMVCAKFNLRKILRSLTVWSRIEHFAVAPWPADDDIDINTDPPPEPQSVHVSVDINFRKFCGIMPAVVGVAADSLLSLEFLYP